MSKNDDRILQLKKKIEDKEKTLLSQKKKFIPETTCQIELHGIKYNLHTCKEETLEFLLIVLNSYKISAENLNIKMSDFSGFGIDKWMSDIQCKLNMLKVKREEKELHDMKSKLDTLLSEDKKTELEIDTIAALLG